MNSRLMLISFAFAIAISLCLVSPSCSKEGLTINSTEKGLTFAMNNNMKNKQNMRPKVFLWRSGNKTKLNSKQQWVIQLLQECEKLFTSADDALWEVVTVQTIKKVRGKAAIELQYPKTMKFSLNAINKSVLVDGLLIPLNPLYHDTAVIYYRMVSYCAGPVINTHGKKIIDNIKQVLIEKGLLD